MVVYAIYVIGESAAYYGSTAQLRKRWRRHVYDMARGQHHNANLQNWYEKVGLGGLSFVELTGELPQEAAWALELELLARADALNIGRGTRGGDNLTRHPERRGIAKSIADAQRKKMSAMSEQERKDRWGRAGEQNPMWGRTHSDQTRAQLSEKCKDRQSHLKLVGAALTDDGRQRLREAGKAKTGVKNPFYGRSHSDETKARLAKSMQGRVPSNVRPVVCDGVSYGSATAAGRALNTCTATILYRIKSKHWNYNYA